MECAAHLDVMKLDELLESESYERGVDLLERIVAMLTKLIDPWSSHGVEHLHDFVPVPERGHHHGSGHGKGHAHGHGQNWCPFLRVAARYAISAQAKCTRAM
jgi:hypothetical protein